MRLSIDVQDLANLFKHTAQNIQDTDTAAAILDLITRDIAVHEGVSYEVIFDALQRAQ